MNNIYALSLMSLVFFSCNSGNETSITLSGTENDLYENFTVIDTLRITSDSIYAIYSLVADNDEVYLSDYIAGNFLSYNIHSGKTKHILAKGDGPGEVQFPTQILKKVEDTLNNSYYVVDNASRRLNFIENGQFANSYIFTGNHIAPVAIKSNGDYLFAGGLDQTSNQLIHVYDQKGVLVDSFYDVAKKLSKTSFGGATNYPFFEVDGNITIAIQSYDYAISLFEGNDLIKHYKIENPKFKTVNDDLIVNANNASTNRDFDKLKSIELTPSRIIKLLKLNDLVIVEWEQYSGDNIDDIDYLEDYGRYLDVYDSDLNPIISNIKSSGMHIKYADQSNANIYFKIAANDEANKFNEQYLVMQFNHEN